MRISELMSECDKIRAINGEDPELDLSYFCAECECEHQGTGIRFQKVGVKYRLTIKHGGANDRKD